ncbi:MAG: LacI family DNA-binding transcriptional regulator, partial [Pseudomonadota bacterium]
TVSRVLNSPDVVQKDTRAKVERVIAELGFRPSAAARAALEFGVDIDRDQHHGDKLRPNPIAHQTV